MKFLPLLALLISPFVSALTLDDLQQRFTEQPVIRAHFDQTRTIKDLPQPLRSQGQMCPRQAAMAIKPSQKGLTPNSYAPHTGNIPFRTSKISTATAAPLPPIRNTLVAPGLPEPLVRGSGNPHKRQTRMALEMEPQRYAMRIIPGAIALISCSVLKIRVQR